MNAIIRNRSVAVTPLVHIHAPVAALPFAPAEGPLLDTFGRTHTDFRISVIDRCNIRCFYCMPEEGGKFVPNSGLLSYPEIVRIARAAVRLGVRKIRLTGGEPLLRPDLPTLMEGLARLPLSDLALTTNGVLLADRVQALRNAGLRRLNVHLDTLDRQRFFQITRRDDLPRVLAGIDAAASAGMQVKLNAVAVRDLTEPDLIPLTRFARERGLELRFIEFMPLDAQGLWRETSVLTAGEMIARISEEFGPLTAVPDSDPRAPATEYRFADGARIGFIASVSRPFCHNCNRIRLTSDGKLRYCLFAREETDLRAALAEPFDDALETLFRRTVWEKWSGHDIGSPAFESPQRPMYSIGG
jgi:cyclic pyranopterin phosphate synthase